MKGIYLVGGYPDRKTFRRCLLAVAEAGADFVEVGIPFNDPVADGPVIADATLKAANAGITADMVLEDIEAVGEIQTAVYAMTYSNILYSYGIRRFSDRSRDTLHGVILADLPNRMHRFFRDRGMAVPLIPFATLESRDDDFTSMVDGPGGFIYFVGLRGITGSSADFRSPEITDRMRSLKTRTGKNVVVGFGVKTVDDARSALALGDGFVVGTEAVKRQRDVNALREYVEVILGHPSMTC